MEAAMDPVTVWIPGPLPGLNEIIRAKGASGAPGGKGRRWNAYGALKKEWEAKIIAAVRKATTYRFEAPVSLGFHWVEASRRRDQDNIAAGGRKLCLDSFVASGLLPGDGWRHVRGFWDQFSVDPARPGVMVTIVPAEEEESDG
jgi:hypothetical protein